VLWRPAQHQGLHGALLSTDVKVRATTPVVPDSLGDHICPDTGGAGDDDPFEMIEALCGARAYLYLNGDIVPKDYDFYTLGCGHEAATCKACRKAAGLHDA